MCGSPARGMLSDARGKRPMLDAETKSRIDSARDILVGKVPDPKSQVEQITIALIYKFMDDMDRQPEELGGKASFFTGEFKKYRWANLLDKRLGGHERLILYAEGIEKMNVNKNIPQLFRDIFKGGEKGDGGSKTTCERGDIRHIQKLLKVIHSERGERDVRAECV